MTPRERAEAVVAKIPPLPELNAVLYYALKRSLFCDIEAAIIADRRELLADDEATVEVMAKAMQETNIIGGGCATCEEHCRATFAALRRLRGVETTAGDAA